jgi:hypothetical protein
MMRLPHSSVHPDRLVGIASVDLSRPMFAIRELRRASANSDFAVYVFCPGCGTYLPMTGGFTHSMQSVWSLITVLPKGRPHGTPWAEAGLRPWWERISTRPSFVRTQVPPRHESHAVG